MEMDVWDREDAVQACLKAAEDAAAPGAGWIVYTRPVRLLGWGLPEEELQKLKAACDALGLKAELAEPDAGTGRYGADVLNVQLLDMDQPESFLERGAEGRLPCDLLVGWFSAGPLRPQAALDLRKRLHELQERGLEWILHVGAAVPAEARRRSIAAAAFFFAASESFKQAREVLSHFLQDKQNHFNPLPGDRFPYRYAWLSLGTAQLYEHLALRSLAARRLPREEDREPEEEVKKRFRSRIEDCAARLAGVDGEEPPSVSNGLKWLPCRKEKQKLFSGKPSAGGRAEERLYGAGPGSPGALRRFAWLNSPYRGLEDELTQKIVEALGKELYSCSRGADPNAAQKLRCRVLEDLAEEWKNEIDRANDGKADAPGDLLAGYAGAIRLRLLRRLALAGKKWLEENRWKYEGEESKAAALLRKEVSDRLGYEPPEEPPLWDGKEPLGTTLSSLLGGADEEKAWGFLDPCFKRWEELADNDARRDCTDTAFITVQILLQGVGGVRSLRMREPKKWALRMLLPVVGPDPGDARCLTLRIHSHSAFIPEYFEAEREREEK